MVGTRRRDAAAQAVDRRLSIGAFARRTRLSPKALRLYDRLGLLRPADVDAASSYRRYRESQLATARLVAMLRRLDMPLAEIAAILAAPDQRGADLLGRFWLDREQRHAGQRELVAHLRRRLCGEEGNFAMFEIREREVPEQVVVSEQRHVLAPDLAAWIEEAKHRVDAVATRFGGKPGPWFIVYHGEVSEDSDGPVELCVPIDPAYAGETSAPIRTVPGYREAYTRISKAQVGYPQILSAYDAVSAWLGERGHNSAAPRELYLAVDWDSAAPMDEVCDIGFPIL
jgi:DNA-binding transcriptional MerR regulator